MSETNGRECRGEKGGKVRQGWEEARAGAQQGQGVDRDWNARVQPHGREDGSGESGRPIGMLLEADGGGTGRVQSEDAAGGEVEAASVGHCSAVEQTGGTQRTGTWVGTETEMQHKINSK